jgi:citrate lyase beta subunit
MVRINRGSTADLDAVLSLQLDALVLPKAEPEALELLPSSSPPVIAIVETARGLRSSFELVSDPRVGALMLGAIDLGAELGLEPRPDGLELLHARSRLVVDSAAGGIRAPFDGVHADVRDAEGLVREIALARSLGFRGKACIHPGQIGAVNDGFAPRPEKLDGALLRGPRRRRRVPQPARADGDRGRQRLVHVPDDEHEPDPPQRRLRGDDALRSAARH